MDSDELRRALGRLAEILEDRGPEATITGFQVTALLDELGISLGPLPDEAAADAGLDQTLLAPGKAPATDPRRLLSNQSNPVVPDPQPDDPGGLPHRLGRFEVVRELGVGGMGRVLEARDPDLRRHVAVKMLARPDKVTVQWLKRFIAEAQITAQLEHPSIVPVHDVGVTPAGEIYFVMKKVAGASLQAVFAALRDGDEQMRAHWTRRRLLHAFVQVCHAVAYAHSRRVLHRDLKPANIMLGAFGEVQVMDWGVARLEGDDSDGLDHAIDKISITQTVDGLTIGTAGYMSPEQALGRFHLLDGRSDQWSLGAILYEILTGERAFAGQNPMRVLYQAATEAPVVPAKRAPDKRIPDEIAGVCLKAMALDPDDRYAEVADLARAVEDFLEGARRREAAAGRLAEAQSQWRVFGDLAREELALVAREARLRRAIAPWAGLDEKEELLSTRDRLLELETDQAEAFERVVTTCEQALSHDPEHPETRAFLAEVFWSRLLAAEERSDVGDQAYYERRVRQYDDGRFTQRLQRVGALSLRTEPPGAEVIAQRFVKRSLVWALGDPEPLGDAPLDMVGLAVGSYLLTLRAPGCRDTRYPVRIDRVGLWDAGDSPVPLFSDAEIGDGFVYVPPGPFLRGGDPAAAGSPPRGEERLPPFFISALSVTMREYLDFINALHAEDPEAAWRRVPRTGSGRQEASGQLWDRPATGERYRLPEGEMDGAPWDAAWPAFGIDWYDARAYAAWMSARDGVTYDLPTDLEWEKAARGVDARLHPWGDGFDASLCKMRDSRPGRPLPEPVGTFPSDRSIYGMRDVAGTIRNWCADDNFDGDPERRSVRGGAWLLDARYCRSAVRLGFVPWYVGIAYGFRLVRRQPLAGG